jgi:hypothetical protein
MNTIKSFALFFCTIFMLNLAACSNAAKQKQQEQKPANLTTGQVISRVVCRRDSSLSYALYLPKNYDPSRRLPLIIAFDSHAAGKLPVDLFCAEAEHYGYIIAGSNNSKNGVAWDITSSQYEVMRKDILQKLSVDTNKIYTAGFSGGSRVASSVAIFTGGVAGVIGCAAGFPQIDKPISHKFSYLGIVGNEDFNYTEMKALDKGLEGAGFAHHLLVFNGKHAWPPAEIVPSIFAWLELDAMRQKLKEPDQNFIRTFSETCLKEADSLSRKNEVVAEYLQCIKAKDYLNGVADISAFSERIEHLIQTEPVKRQAIEDERIAQKETQLQQYYAGSIGPQSEDWWKAEVKRLNGPTGNNIAKTDRAMYKRVLSYLSLAAYMKSNGALQSGDKEKAGYFIRIYALVDPTNPEAPYLEADLLASQGKEDDALKSLSKAFDLGFNDLKRIQNDPAFVNFKGKPDYEQIINRIQNNK